MKLIELIESIDGITVHHLKQATEIRGITDNSREVKPGFLFAALQGIRTDGINFVQDAIKRGATCILSHVPPASHNTIPWIQSKNERKVFSDISRKFYNYPDKELKIIGITGTNGKTSTSYILDSLFSFAGYPVGVMGTISYRWGNQKVKASLTTPQPPVIYEIMRRMVNDSISHLVMEVSSHSIDTERVSSIDFDYAVFTNLTGDHLDYHGDMETYFDVKKKLFHAVAQSGQKSFLNIDDPYGKRLKHELSHSSISFGIYDTKADIKAKEIEYKNTGTKFSILSPYGKMTVRTNLLGEMNVYNILASVGVAIENNVSFHDIEAAFKSLDIKIPGRMDLVKTPFFPIYIDYAHSDDSLKRALLSLRRIENRKIIVVFGAGGDRDVSKRPRMGKVATMYADEVIITSDNPRTEDPLKIISDICSGAVRNNYKVVPDRGEAIKEAIKSAGVDDVILLAGKGHENYQVLNDGPIHFSDFEEVEKILKELKK